MSGQRQRQHGSAENWDPNSHGGKLHIYQARAVIAEYRTYSNERRPHSALRYLCPRDYYSGDPAKFLLLRFGQDKTFATKTA